MNRVPACVIAIVSLAPYVGGASAHAQEPAQTEPLGDTQTRRLEFRGTLSESFDTNLAAEAFGVQSLSPLQQGGFSTLATGSLLYSQPLGPVQMSTSAGASGRQYRSSSTFSSSSRYASLGLSAQLWRRTTFTVDETVTYSSTFFFLERLLAASDPLQSNVGTAQQRLGVDGPVQQGLDNTFRASMYDSRASMYDSRAYMYSSSASLRHAVSRRSTLELSGSHRYTDLAALTDQLSFDYAAMYSYRLNRNAALVLGYAYAEGAHGYGTGDEVPVTSDLQVGINYERPLSLSRRTTVSFMTGSSLHRTPLADDSLPDAVGRKPATVQGATRNQATVLAGGRDRLQYRLLVDAVVQHRVGRTWAATLTYSRSVGLVEGLRAPLFSDNLGATIGGSFGRRFSVGLSAAYTDGEALSGMATGLRTYREGVTAQFQLGRLWAISGEYLYYFYDVAGDVAAWAPGLAQSLERDSLRVGLSMRLPVIGR